MHQNNLVKDVVKVRLDAKGNRLGVYTGILLLIIYLDFKMYIWRIQWVQIIAVVVMD